MSPALAGRFLSTVPPGKSYTISKCPQPFLKDVVKLGSRSLYNYLHIGPNLAKSNRAVSGFFVFFFNTLFNTLP